MSEPPKLLRYDAARAALEKAYRVDEVKTLRDKALALEAYARQAKDHEMQAWVTEIKIRAERRTGELLREMAKQSGALKRGNSPASSRNESGPPTLKSLGISHDESSLWQKLAKIPQGEFERRLKTLDTATLTTKKILSNGGTTVTRRSRESGTMLPETRCFFDIEARLRETFFGLKSDQREYLLESIRELLKNLESEVMRHE